MAVVENLKNSCGVSPNPFPNHRSARPPGSRREKGPVKGTDREALATARRLQARIGLCGMVQRGTSYTAVHNKHRTKVTYL